VRLTGNPQQELEKNIIKIMQQHKMQQGSFAAVLGAYQMSTDKNITADNTEIFYTSPLQTVTNQQAFSLAAELAKTFNQDSVAVFIPVKTAAINEVKIYFNKNKPTLAQAVAVIKEKLPPAYSQAFSLSLDRTCAGFNTATVRSIEWMGGHLDTQLIQKTFPQQIITTQKGAAYLVYKNGKVTQL
jgi:hypothetical protein